MILTERIFQTTSKALDQANTMMSEAISMRQS
jgi:flagellar hook protein FlgE